MRSIPRLRRLIARERVDTVFHAQWQTLIASVLIRHMANGSFRIFAAAHGRELLLNPLRAVPLLNRGFDRFRSRLLKQTDGLFPVSRFTAGLLEKNGVSPGNIHVIHNGTDPERFRPVDGTGVRSALDLDDHPTLLTVSRLVPRKGIDTVLRALPELLDVLPDTRYVVAGDGPDRERLETLARELGVHENTRFAGRVPNEHLAEYYSMCDLFVLTARTIPPSIEGFGIVFLEANACGKPVIGSRSGGIPDAIEDGRTGYLVDPDDPSAVAEKALHLLKNPETARRMGRRGRQRVRESFTWEKVAGRMWEVLTPPTAAG